MAASLSVGVVLYRNSRQQLEKLVASIEVARQQPGTPAFEVAWFDNAPDEGTGRVLASLGVEDKVVASAANVGFGAGHNALMKRAFAARETKWYVCLNPDAIVHPACFRNLIDEALAHRKAGLVEAVQFPDEHPKAYDTKSHETPWCSGCTLLITRDCYEAIGGFDEQLFLYCEDVDISWRARAAGLATLVAPRALVHHYVRDRVPGGRVWIEMLKSGAYLGRKWGSPEFSARCFTEYQQLTGQTLEVPECPRPTRAMKSVADFAHGFSFTVPRW